MFSDHINFVRGLTEIMQAPEEPIDLARANHDLREELRQQVLNRPTSAIQVYKVKAHVKLGRRPTAEQVWRKRHNDWPDEQAKKQNRDRGAGSWEQHGRYRRLE
ncbi:unnamed protein product [Polarella glacialis]|uniref:Uncharacterized protein n=1 Tax=Polarella glacialis TaxID=89957 RepID=A0A813EVF0_POLGL|nr:unnamed protein product [Polarella glacialis]